MKLKYLLLLFLFSFAWLSSWSQSLVDSLKVALHSSTNTDTARVNLLLRLSNKSLHLGDSALAYATEALEMSKSLKWNKGIYNSYKNIGAFYIGTHKNMRAIDYLYEALKVAENENQKGIIYRFLGDAYSLVGDSEKAVSFLKQSIALFEKNKDEFNYLYSLNNLSLVYYDIKEYTESERLLRTGLVLNNHKDRDIAYSMRTNLGLSLLEQDKLEEAQPILESLVEESNVRFPYDLILIYSNLAKIHYKKGELSIAKDYLQKAESEFDKYKLRDDAHNDFDEIAHQVYIADNNFKQGYFHLNRFWEIESKNTKQEAKERIEALEYGFLNSRNEKEIQSLKQIRFFTILFITVLVLLLSALYYFYKRLQQNLRIVEAQKQQLTGFSQKLNALNESLEIKVKERTQDLEKANSELEQKNEEILQAVFKGKTSERLRISQELHDNLGGMITVLNYQVQGFNIENMAKVDQTKMLSLKKNIQATYSELRFISHNLLPSEFETLGLIAALKKLVQDVTEQRELTITFDFEDFNSDYTKNYVAFELYAVGLEAVNNIIKHSFASKAEIILQNSIQNTRLEITDNGKVNLPEKNQYGFGLNSMSTRVEKIGGDLEISGKTIRVTVPHQIAGTTAGQ